MFLDNFLIFSFTLHVILVLSAQLNGSAVDSSSGTTHNPEKRLRLSNQDDPCTDLTATPATPLASQATDSSAATASRDDVMTEVVKITLKEDKVYYRY